MVADVGSRETTGRASVAFDDAQPGSSTSWTFNARTGAVASGAHVIGLCAGTHCAAGHGERLRALGVQDIAADFDKVARLVF